MNCNKTFLRVIFILILFQLTSCVNEPSLHINKRNINKSEIDENIKNAILKLGISDGDTIVDIGCGDGSMDFEIFKLFPSSFFVLEDIEKKKIDNGTVHLLSGTKKHFKDSYRFTLGLIDSIPLESNRYRKILFSCVLHELDNPSALINEINRIMTKDAKLIIVEPIRSTRKKDHLSCDKPFLTKEKIIEIVTTQNFNLTTSDITNNTRPNTFQRREYNILIFTKKG